MLRVFISYSYDNDAHMQRVHALADRLIKDGVHLILDRYCGPGGPDEGWDKWSERQAKLADIVLPVFTPDYKKCWDGEQLPGMRLGAIRELKVLDRRFYHAGNYIDFCHILTYEDKHRINIPLYLQGLPAFDSLKDYDHLIAWLRDNGAASDPTTAIPELIRPIQLFSRPCKDSTKFCLNAKPTRSSLNAWHA